jgi:hypothetical protein
MKCLKCSQDTLPGKALCAECFAVHEARESYQKTGEWINSTLDATRDKFKRKGAGKSDTDAASLIERLAIIALIGGSIVCFLIWLQSLERDLGAGTPSSSSDEQVNGAAIPVTVAATPSIDPQSRSVWVGNSPGSIPLLSEALELIRRQERGPELRWTIKLEAGEHRVTDGIVVPRYSTILGRGQLQSSIVGMTSGLDFNDESASLVVLETGARIEQTAVVNEGSGNTTAVLRCSSSQLPNPEAPGDTFNVVRGVTIESPNPADSKYGIINNGCDLRLEQVTITTGNGSTTSEAFLSIGEASQTSITKSSLVAEDAGGECSAQTTAGCVGLSIVRGTVSLTDSTIRGASQGTSVLDGTLQLIRSEVTSPSRGVVVIQSGTLIAHASKISSVATASSGQVVCKETTKPDGTLYSGDCS